MIGIDKEDLKLIIAFIEESNKLLRDNGYSPKESNIQLLNRLKLKLELNEPVAVCGEIKYET